MENLHEESDKVLDEIQNHLKSGDLMGAFDAYRLALANARYSPQIGTAKLGELRNEVQTRLTSLGIDPLIIELVTSSD